MVTHRNALGSLPLTRLNEGSWPSGNLGAVLKPALDCCDEGGFDEYKVLVFKPALDQTMRSSTYFPSS